MTTSDLENYASHIAEIDYAIGAFMAYRFYMTQLPGDAVEVWHLVSEPSDGVARTAYQKLVGKLTPLATPYRIVSQDQRHPFYYWKVETGKLYFRREQA